VSTFIANPPTLGDGSDKTPHLPTYEHAEEIGAEWWEAYPLPPEVEAFIANGRRIRENLAAAERACEEARNATKETPR
jgi:hypothetical protein